MANLLHIDSSPRGERSHSRKLSSEFVQQWLAKHPGDQVTYRDLGTHPMPLVDEPWIAAVYTPEEQRTPEMQSSVRVSDEVIAELLKADVLVFGVPMYNFGLPAGFKAYIDQIVRVGKTFSGQTFQGLVQGKRAYILMSAGQQYSPGGPMASFNQVEPYLKTIFGFIGITDLHFVAVATSGGDQVLEQTRAQAKTEIQKLTAEAA